MAKSIKIIGVMRFSVLTSTYYSEKFDTLEALAAHLFAPERMALRFHIFETLVLPSLMAQTDQDFELVIVTAEQLPLQYLERLNTLLEDIPNVHLQVAWVDNHYQLLKSAYASVDPGDATHVIKFRLDDDDALGLNYIKRLRRTGTKLLEFQPASTPQIISFNRGFYVEMKAGENDVFDAVERSPLSAGTALIAPVEYSANPYRYNHRKLPQYYNTYSDISVPAFIRTVHGDNKSNPTQMGISRQLARPALKKQLRKYFGVELSDLETL